MTPITNLTPCEVWYSHIRAKRRIPPSERRRQSDISKFLPLREMKTLIKMFGGQLDLSPAPALPSQVCAFALLNSLCFPRLVFLLNSFLCENKNLVFELTSGHPGTSGAHTFSLCDFRTRSSD